MANKNPSSPENVPIPGKVGKAKGPEEEKTIPNKKAFESHLNEPAAPATQGPEEGKQISPMELTQPGQKPPANATFDSLLNQINTTQNTLNNLQNNLNTPKLAFKHSQQRLLDNKLTEAKSHLNAASQKLGAQMPEETQVPQGATPVKKFLTYVTDGQNQLQAAQKKLQELSSSGQNLQPGELMQVQVKLAQAQQEIEYASVLLSKVVDVIKQTINIQI